LFFACQTSVTAPTDSRAEAYADKSTEIDSWVVLRESRSKSNDAAYAFVPANVRELDDCDGRAIWARSRTGRRVQVY
jgi:hypothetical protein